MYKVLINYADERFESVRKINTWSGKIIAGFDRVIEYGPDDIDNDFLNEYKNILRIKRGNGLWLWKPYFIAKTLEGLDDGDYLFYLDSGAFFVRSIEPLIKSMAGDIYVSDLPLIERQWTKPGVLEALCGNEESIAGTNQIQASFILFRKSKISTEFVNEWLGLCCNSLYLLPEEGTSKYFIAHREDQSLLSILCKKKGISPHKDPSQFGRFPDGYFLKPEFMFKTPEHTEPYKPCIVLHRYDRIYKRAFLKYILMCRLPYHLARKIYYKKGKKKERG